MHYRLYSTEDFIQDEFFQQWVFCPNEERNHYWSTFLLHYPGQQKKIDDAREFLLVMDFQRDVPESVVESIKYNFNEAIDEFESAKKQNVEPASGFVSTRETSFLKVAYSIAASLIFVAVLIGYVIHKDIPIGLLQALTLEQQETVPGKKLHFILADGTQVWLNADSKLKYPQKFAGKTSREVYLDGEAFFDVAENKEVPFIVHTGELAIKVLGTAFNVKSYADDRVVETTLVRGKVSVGSREKNSFDAVTLLPDQQALFSKDLKTVALLKENVDTESYVAWKDGWLMFDDKPFSYIKATLERWYDVTIIMEDEKSLSCTFSAKFKDKTLQDVMEIFSSTAAINYVIEGNQVFVKGKLCQYDYPN